MNWEAIGAIGEVVGALAVLLTLVYLAIQIRQNTRQVENHLKTVDLASFNAIDESFSRFRHMLATSPQTADLWRRTKQDYLSIDDSEREQADALAWEWLIIYQNMYHRTEQIVRSGSDAGPTDNNAEQMEFLVRRELSHPGLRQWWYANNSDRFFPSFQEIGNRVYSNLADHTDST